jgi:hypothetical protein
VLRTRPLAVGVGLAMAAAPVAGCGGHSPKPSAPSTTAHTSATPTPVVYAPEHVKSSLLAAHDVDSRTHNAPVTLVGLGKSSVPSCADTSIKLPAGAQIVVRQYDPSDSRSSAPTYASLAAVYPDAAAASPAFALIRSKVSACPGKQHVKSKRLKNKQFTLAYDETWKTTTDTVSGWTHIRGFEKLTYSAAASIINVIYEVHDYAVRGNTVLATAYLKRVKPSAAEGPIARQATTLLTKQLAKIA